MQKQTVNQTARSTDQTVLDAAQAMARKVGESKAYKEYDAASAAFRGDKEAQELFQRYQNVTRETQMMRSWGGSSKSHEERLRQVEKEAFANPVLNRYFAAQDDLLACLRELNEYLTSKLGFDFAALTKPAGGCC